MSRFGWKAHVEHDWLRQGDRLFLGKENADGSYEVLVFTGLPTMVHVEAGVALPDNAALMLPQGAWPAVCDAAAPTTSALEVKRLEEALAVERARVDAVLHSVTSRSGSPDASGGPG